MWRGRRARVALTFSPRGEAKWTLDYDRFIRGNDPDLLSSALFAESQTEACIYREVPVYSDLLMKSGEAAWLSQRWSGARMA